ncbi:MAG: hypothetical protein KJ065_15935 [Anaerolineae bacterium]|nr:hypothetical protein [Anaerolineae bacterium]
MLNAKDLLVHQQRQHELQREAQNERLARESRSLWRATKTALTTKRTPMQTTMRKLSRLTTLFL